MGRWAVIRRVLWPARATLFAVLGTGVGMAGDVISFFSAFLTSLALVAIAAAVTLIAAIPCLKTSFAADAGDPAAVERAVSCLPCDAMRTGLFATAAFLVLAVIGNGDSATATIARRLGVIEASTTATRQDVGELLTIAQPQAIIADPTQPADHFNNAWVYQNMRRDAVAAAREMTALYAGEAPRKLDAAQLYFEAASATRPRDAVLAEMQAMAERSGDATLLIVAARAAAPAEADRLLERARAMDPQLPFAWWDPMRMDLGGAGRTMLDAKAQAAGLRERIARIEKFRTLYSAQPPARWFYLPQQQGDLTAIAQSMVASFQQTLGTYEAIEDGSIARQGREQARRALQQR